ARFLSHRPRRVRVTNVRPGGAPAMRAPECWLAVLRIAVGVWFAKALFTKLSVTLLWGFLPVPAASERWQHVMPMLVGKYAEGNPVGFFRNFMLQITTLIVIFATRAGRTWGVDGWVRARRPGSWLARLPLG